MQRFFPADKIHLTGNPVRADLLQCTLTRAEAKSQLGFSHERPLVLVLGGSLGARTINESVAASLQVIAASGASLLWQTGKLYVDEFSPMVANEPTAKASAFITDMAVAYRAADLVVSRAGAGTISELQLLGKAAVLVPSPNVAEDHQRKNAEALSSRGAAVMILDADSRTQLAPAVSALLSDAARRETLEANIAKMALALADEKIVDIIKQIER
jgi:UDP-N-acetylglucosamine--N-acetylmuramyl-(pentapeptide) pyrophosphoryl-undecaprenol N-acetylglucosamine transferase